MVRAQATEVMIESYLNGDHPEGVNARHLGRAPGFPSWSGFQDVRCGPWTVAAPWGGGIV